MSRQRNRTYFFADQVDLDTYLRFKESAYLHAYFKANKADQLYFHIIGIVGEGTFAPHVANVLLGV